MPKKYDKMIEQNNLNDWKDYYPLCPHCEEEIEIVNAYVIPLKKSIPQSIILFSNRKKCVVTSCPHCRKIIGTYDYYQR